MYVYIFDGYDCYTVGFYQPDGTWEPEIDHHTATEAVDRVRYLNGGAVRRGGLQEMKEMQV